MNKLAIILIVLVNTHIYSENPKPVLAVLSFNYSGIGKSEAEVFTDYLISAFVETNRFRVIQKADRNLILSEQEYTLSDTSDELSQIEVGKLLSANQIVIGSDLSWSW